MRISKQILSIVAFGAGLGLAAAYAFDGTPSPSDRAPPFGAGSVPETGPGLGTQTDAYAAWRAGSDALRNGDIKAALISFEHAARNGEVRAAWKLGSMYANGEGVQQSDARAFEYYRGLAVSHADEVTGTPEARLVALAYVALGDYYLTGIPNSNVKADAAHAHEMFSYAASIFGDPDAQYRLGRSYLDGQGTAKDSKQAARWLSLAASKGQYHAQAAFGAMLFKGQQVQRDAPRGLMLLTLAKDAASPKETSIADLYAAAMKQATEQERAVALVLLEQWMARSRNGHR